MFRFKLTTKNLYQDLNFTKCRQLYIYNKINCNECGEIINRLITYAIFTPALAQLSTTPNTHPPLTCALTMIQPKARVWRPAPANKGDQRQQGVTKEERDTHIKKSASLALLN